MDGALEGLFHEAHPDPRRLADRLACQSLGAGPRCEALVVVGGIGVLQVAMRAPAVLVFASREFRTAAQLRAAGEAAGIIRAPAVAQGGENVAAADLVAEEMRRRRHHG